MKYYVNNITGGLNLLKAMIASNVDKILFSSSCTVFGNASSGPINEGCPINPVNPYGQTKRIFEQVLKACEGAYGLKSVIFRYFNVAGASADSSIGEMHNPETHLIPISLYAALGKKEIKIFGEDYPTPDGTCVRDYVHVEDVAKGHLLAMKHLLNTNNSDDFNLGTGKGYSVKQVIEAVKDVTSCDIKCKAVDRISGDPAVLICDNKKIKRVLHWKPEHPELRDIIKTAWDWHKK